MHVTLRTLSLGALVAVASTADAQVNVERFRPGAEETGFSGEARLNIAARTGNVEVVELGAEGRVDYLTENVRWFLIGRGDLGWNGGERYANEALLHLRHERRLRPTLRVEAFTQVNYDKSRLLLFRGLAGAGLRIGLVRASTVRVWLGTAYMLEHERIDVPAGAVHPTEVTAHRLSSYLSTSLGLGGRASVVSTVYVQPRIGELGDTRVLGETGISTPIVGSVALTVSFRLRFDGDPPDDVNELDTALQTGIAVSF